MFLFKDWEEICCFISQNCNSYRADEIKIKRNNFIVCIKHDVETNVRKSLIMAEIEKKYNLKTTYYFQLYLFNCHINLI